MKIAKSLAALALGLASSAGTGYLGYRLGAPTPVPNPSTPFVALGKAYAAKLAAARAEAYRAAADALDAGKAIVEVQGIDQATFKAAREKAFDQSISPALEAIVKAGDPAPTDVARRTYAAALRGLATGLDGKAPSAPRAPPFVVGMEAKRFGWVDSPTRLRVVATLPHRTLSLAAPRLMAGAKDESKDVFLYRAWSEVLGAYPDYPAQQIGDCTSFGSGHALDLLQCIDLALSGSTEKASLYRETCTEAIYGLGRQVAGMLGSRGDGCYGVAVAKALTEFGAVPREVVGAYSGQRAKEWGYRGVPDDVKAKAAEHKLGAATLVTTLAEADAALDNGYPFILCSNQGFSMRRDGTGLCEAQGRWAHCMFVAGRRTRSGEAQYLVCQSWGSAVPSGPLADDQPSFSFWIRGRVLVAMLRAEDSLAFSRFAGFVARPLPVRWSHSGFADPQPEVKKIVPIILPLHESGPTTAFRKAG